MKRHSKKFGIYHWDTFDDETFLRHEEDTLELAEKWVVENYGYRINEDHGADQVDIVDDSGEIVKKYHVT